MNSKNDIPTLFDRWGNLTPGAMQRYINGQLGPEELKAVESHLENSPFDREALEGFRQHPPADLEKELASLDDRIIRKAKEIGGAPVRHISRRYYLAAAASLAGLAVLTVLLVYMFRSPVNDQMAITNPALPALEKQPVTTSPSSSSLVADTSTIENRQSSIENMKVGGIAMAEEQKIPDKNDVLKEMTVQTPESPAIIVKPETRNPEPETIIPEPVTRNPEPVSGEAVEMDMAISREVTAGKASASKKGADDIFVTAEEMPQFPGGEDSLYQYIKMNIHYPDSAAILGIEGKVYIQFVVEKDGSITNVELLRGIGGGCNEEAIRVISGMPAWIPGKQDGQPIRVSYILPVKFSLHKKEN